MPVQQRRAPRSALAIHGGAGALSRTAMTSVLERRYRAGLDAALTAGWHALRGGGSALDAVCAAIVILEDDALFNAGRGAALNADGECEMDASIMDGATLSAGAVAAVRRIKNPVLAARAVMEHTPHVLLAGAAADRVAAAHGGKLMPPAYFHTRKSVAALKRVMHRQSTADSDRHGTVGAVALDESGNLAAATSTGGYTNKMPGRVGDTAVIGAGTYASNGICAVSCTGHGETFIRAAIAHDIAARVRYLRQPLARAVDAALDTVAALGATGGVIALNATGAVTISFNSMGMYRAYMDARGRAQIAIF